MPRIVENWRFFATIGDSFFAIQWGSCCVTYPRRLADWVEEIHHIAAQLKCTFNHILHDINDVANYLARKGVPFNFFFYFLFFVLVVFFVLVCVCNSFHILW